MSAIAQNTAALIPMSSEARGKAIKARRLRHGIKSVRQFAEQSGVSREAITAAEDGSASESTYARLEAWLDSFEEETGAEEEEGRAIAAQTRSQWPQDVQVFLDVMGVYLSSMDEDRRKATIRDLIQQIVAS